jgi:hypothetical protein
LCFLIVKQYSDGYKRVSKNRDAAKFNNQKYKNNIKHQFLLEIVRFPRAQEHVAVPWSGRGGQVPVFSGGFTCDEAVFFPRGRDAKNPKMVFGREKYRPRTRKDPKLLGRIVMYLTTLFVHAMRYLLPGSHRINVENVSIRHEKASKFPSKKLRIVHLSDIHHDEAPFVPRILHSQLDEVVEISNSLEADLILITGMNLTILLISIIHMQSYPNSVKRGPNRCYDISTDVYFYFKFL